MAGAWSSTWRRSIALALRVPRGDEQIGQVGVDRRAPGLPVVAAGRLVQRGLVALELERGGDAAVVVDVVLVRAHGERRRNRTLERLLAQQTADEPHDPPEAREALLHVVVAGDEERRRLEEQAGERLGVAALGVEHGKAA